MATELFVVGTSQSVAAAPVRERMHVELEEVYGELKRMVEASVVEEALPLATCGRLEVYGVSTRPLRALRILRGLMAARTCMSRGELEAYSYVCRGDEAARHLFRVAAGLDSVICGEAQILGQVRGALLHPSSDGVADTFLKRLFQSALAAGKRVRTETEIGRGAASVAGAAIGLLEEAAGSFAGSTALVLGSGKTGALVARMLRKYGVARLVVANRTVETAQRLANELDGEAYGLEAVADLVRQADIIVGTVGGRYDLITRHAMEQAARDEARRRYLLDLAHPRNFPAELGEVHGVTMLDLALVFQRVGAAREARAAQVPRAEAIVDAEVENFAQWVRSRSTASVLRAVREQVLALAQEEAWRRSRGRSEEEREELQRFARSLARTLLHAPTAAIREADPSRPEGAWLLRSASSLFGVSGDAVARGSR